jgi:hypothetical protein
MVLVSPSPARIARVLNDLSSAEAVFDKNQVGFNTSVNVLNSMVNKTPIFVNHVTDELTLY